MGFKVKAKELGFYGGILREPDTEFEIDSLSQRGRWMEFKSNRDLKAWERWKNDQPEPTISEFLPPQPKADGNEPDKAPEEAQD